MCGFKARKVQLVESRVQPLGPCGLISEMLMRMPGIKTSEDLNRRQTQRFLDDLNILLLVNSSFATVNMCAHVNLKEATAVSSKLRLVKRVCRGAFVRFEGYRISHRTYASLYGRFRLPWFQSFV